MKKNGELLHDMIEEAVGLGEAPYRSNRRIVKFFDIEEDKKRGMEAISDFTVGAGVLLKKLKELDNAAKNLARHATRFL